MGGGASSTSKEIPYFQEQIVKKNKERKRETLEDTTEMDEWEFSQMDATFLNTDGGEQLKESTQLFAAKTKIKEWLKNNYNNVDEFFPEEDSADEFHEKLKGYGPKRQRDTGGEVEEKKEKEKQGEREKKVPPEKENVRRGGNQKKGEKKDKIINFN